MTKGILLFADNRKDFLDTRKELLERDGYKVLAASNPKEARQILHNYHVDLAIIDIRLEDDNDGKDTSGLVLAKESPPSIPKVMLSAFPQYMRDALKHDSSGFGIAVDFIYKDEEVDELLKVVEKILLRNVFIAHGRDESAFEAAKGFLNELGFRPIVAREQPQGGRSLLDVLEDHTNAAAFAIVLLTPDDIGEFQRKSEEAEPRARQNVIFELGYLLGKLGRRKVRVLYKGNTKIPSNYDGVLYIPMDEKGRWKLDLAQEMQSMGSDVDLKRVK